MSTPAADTLVDVNPPRSFSGGLSYTAKAIWGHRELLGLLIRRELKARYKDSSLGFVWSLLRPLAQLLIYYIAIGQFLGAEREIPSFAVYVFTGLTVWGLYSEIVSGTTTSITGNAALVKKVYVPRELFPLGAVGSALFNFGAQFIILLAAAALTNELHLTVELLYLPLGFLTLLLLGFGLGLVLSALNVYLRDVQHLIEVVLLVMFWASPIVYSYDMVHERLAGNWLEQIYLANPVTVVVLAFQKAIWSSGTGAGLDFPSAIGVRLMIMSLLSVLIIIVAQRIFARLEGNFAQEL
ncbi:MAG: ABC transporter permease [Protaetiibacter sp.]